PHEIVVDPTRLLTHVLVAFGARDRSAAQRSHGMNSCSVKKANMRRCNARVSSGVMARPAIPDRASGQHEALPRDERRAGEAISPLELPDRRTRVASVVRRRDRPEGVGRTDDVDLRPAGAARGACIGPYEEPDRHDDEDDPEEHVFASYANACSAVKG